MAAFNSISNILGKFNPTQRLLALVLVLLTIISISVFQFIGNSKPECKTLQEQLTQTQNQLTSTILSQNTFIETITDLRKKTFDLNTELNVKDSIIFAISRFRDNLTRELNSLAVIGQSEVEQMAMLTEPQTDQIIIDYRLSPLLNNQIQYEDTIQINSRVFTPDSISFMGINDSIQLITDSTLSKGKIPWIRRVLGRAN